MTKRNKRLLEFSHCPGTEILGMAIKYVDEDSTLLKLLLLNKDYNEILGK